MRAAGDGPGPRMRGGRPSRSSTMRRSATSWSTRWAGSTSGCDPSSGRSRPGSSRGSPRILTRPGRSPGSSTRTPPVVAIPPQASVVSRPDRHPRARPRTFVRTPPLMVAAQGSTIDSRPVRRSGAAARPTTRVARVTRRRASPGCAPDAGPATARPWDRRRAPSRSIQSTVSRSRRRARPIDWGGRRCGIRFRRPRPRGVTAPARTGTALPSP